MSIRCIRWPEDQDAILHHIDQVHGPSDYEMLSLSYGCTPHFDPADCLVYEDGGAIVGHVMITPRQIQIGESLLPTAEIGVLGVQEAYRNRGIARALLQAIHERLTERGDALGLVFGGPNLFEHWHYEYAIGLYLTRYESTISTALALQAGSWNIEHAYERRTADRLRARNAPVTLRRFYASDLQAVAALYQAESARGHYLLARDEAAWLWQLDYLASSGRSEPDDFLVAEANGQLVAYARLNTQEPVNWFLEQGASRFSVIETGGDHPDALEALLGEIARMAQASGAAQIGLFVHPDSAFMKHALARGASLRMATGAAYVRLHNLALAMERLTPTLEQRLQDSRFASRACDLVITTEDDQTVVQLGGGTPEVVELDIPTTSLVRLITGWYGIEHLTVGYSERHAALLRVLFPARDPKIGMADVI